MIYGSLFSGIEGIGLGLERAGFEPAAFMVEKDPFCRYLLRKHWPNARIEADVRSVTALSAPGADPLPRVDLLCGGFPCQQLSAAGKGEGIGTRDAPTERSGLWWEFDRLVGELAPRWVLIENVAHTWRRWVPVVRRCLWERGYASVPLLLRASEVGARHERARIFLVASRNPAHAHGVALRFQQWGERGGEEAEAVRRGEPHDLGSSSPDDARERPSDGERELRDAGEQLEAAPGSALQRPWAKGISAESGVGGGVHGLSGYVDGPNEVVYALSPSCNTDPVLRDVQQAVDAEAVCGPIRGHGSVPKAAVLRSGVHGGGHAEAGRDGASGSASAVVESEGRLRRMRSNGLQAGPPPYRREPTQRRSGESADTLCAVPSEMALEPWTTPGTAPGRRPLIASRVGPIWVDPEGQCWSVAHLREARIRALGNAVVPACTEFVGRLILAVERDYAKSQSVSDAADGDVETA